MIIKIGSQNPVKVEALRETLKDYSRFRDAQVIPLDVLSHISEQPLSLEETLQGAKNRAFGSFVGCDYGVGLESGLIEVPQTKTGFINMCFCVIYDGQSYATGSSSGFEVPREAVEVILNGGNLTEASHSIGLTESHTIGREEGLIGLLTNGRVTRKDYTKQSIQTALVQIENKELY